MEELYEHIQDINRQLRDILDLKRLAIEELENIEISVNNLKEQLERALKTIHSVDKKGSE